MENWAVPALVISWVLFVPLVYYYITKGNDEKKRRLRESAEKEAIENQHTSEVRRLNGEVGQLNGEVGRLNGEVVQLNGEVGRLNGEVVQLNGEVGRLNREVGRLNGEVGQLNGEVGRLEDEKAELEIKLQDQSRELRDQKNNNRSLRIECDERKKKGHRLRTEHQKLEARFDNLTAEKAKVDSEYNKLRIANGVQNHECIYKQEHQRRVEDYQRLVEVLRQKERDLRQKDEDLRQKDAELRRERGEIQEQMKFIQQQNYDQATNSFLMWDQMTGNMCSIDPYDFFPYERDGRTRPRAMAEMARLENQRYEVQNAYYGEGAQPICMVTGDNVDKLGSFPFYVHTIAAHLSPACAVDKVQVNGNRPGLIDYVHNSPRNYLILRKDIEVAMDHFWITYDFQSDESSTAESFYMILRVVHPEVDKNVRNQLRKELRNEMAKYPVQDKAKVLERESQIKQIIDHVSVKKFDETRLDVGENIIPYKRVLRAHFIVATEKMSNLGWRRGSSDENRTMLAYFERRREELRQYCPSRVNSIDLSITSPSFTSPSADVSNHSSEAPSMLDEVKICSACHKRKGKSKYSKNQWGKRRKARCKSCLETES